MKRTKKCPQCDEIISIYAADCGCHETCSQDGCNEPTVRGRLKLCAKHREEHRDQLIDKANRQTTIKRREERARAKAAEEKKPPVPTAVKVAAPMIKEDRGPAKLKAEKWAQPELTEEERDILDAKQRELDLQMKERDDRRIAASLGLEYAPGKPLASKVKTLSPAEIAAIAETLTAPQYQKELPHYVL